MSLSIFLRRALISNALVFLWCLGSRRRAISSFARADSELNTNEDVCRPIVTTWDVEGPFYTNDTPWTDRIAPVEQLEISSNRLVVEGSVIGRNCRPLGNVLIEPWYAGLPDEKGNLYSPIQGDDKRYRGKFYSGVDGKYRYVQTFPEVYQARDIRHVHLKFSATTPQENHTLTTQMYFRDFLPSKYERYLEGRDSQIVGIVKNVTTGERKVILNIILDVDGIPAVMNPAVPTQIPAPLAAPIMVSPSKAPTDENNNNPSITTNDEKPSVSTGTKSSVCYILIGVLSSCIFYFAFDF